MAQTIEIHPVTRIEGHAKIVLEVGDGDVVDRGHLQVLEIRGFEKLLQGTELYKMPQVTARLCGVCPAAHHLASVVAIESGLGVEPPRDARLLREMLYAGHVIHSHALSNFVLTGPDIILGIDAPPADRNVFSLLRTDADLSKKILRIRSIGQRVVELVGGRGVHPVTAVPGGMATRPGREKLELISGWGWEAVQLLEEIAAAINERLEQLAALREATHIPFHSLALTDDGAHAMIDGTWVVHDAEGREERRFAAADYGDHLVEHVMPGSYMKSVRLRGGEEKHFFVGPLARLNVNHTMGTPKAGAALADFRSQGVPRLAAVDQISARLVEMLYCAERLAQITDDELGDGPIRNDVGPARGGRYVGVIEAPRGILVHDYTADDSGRVTDVNFIVATQNNYDAIDTSITGLARHYLPKGDDNLLLNGVEFALRCFDPCLACATHAAGQMPLTLEIRRRGELVRTVARGAR
jgi:F420-non-reducing hydrogenase large subunit